MASSAFSFHCMICFEEFDPETNYPVVLPCGHTYVCVACANRLDKCMECRTPLTVSCETVPPPPPPGAAPGTPGRPSAPGPRGAATAGADADAQKENTSFRRQYGDRREDSSSARGHAPATPPRPRAVLKQRLPLPKNAVLLSLIQASEPARRGAEVDASYTPERTGDEGSTTPSRPSTFSDSLLGGACGGAQSLVGSLPDDEEHKIRVGTRLEGGPCGTYAVAVKGGLSVYPTLFEHTLPGALDGMRHEEEPHPVPSQTKNKDIQKNDNAVADKFDRPLIRLKYGDRVQVVSMHTRGWVKLARRYGYIRLENDKQLVKVGGTSDKACQMEAMLHELSIERNRLKDEQKKLERLSAQLMIDLQSSLITSGDDQVVVSAPEGSLRRSDAGSWLSLVGGRQQLDTSKADHVNVSNHNGTVLTPRSTNLGGLNPTQQLDQAHREIFSWGSPTDAPPGTLRGRSAGTVHGSWSSASHALTKVNFQTGRSGHRALTNQHSHPHNFLKRFTCGSDQGLVPK